MTPTLLLLLPLLACRSDGDGQATARADAPDLATYVRERSESSPAPGEGTPDAPAPLDPDESRLADFASGEAVEFEGSAPADPAITEPAPTEPGTSAPEATDPGTSEPAPEAELDPLEADEDELPDFAAGEEAEFDGSEPTRAAVDDDRDEGDGFDHGHARWGRLLAAHVEEGLMDYRGLARERAELEAYLSELEAVTPAQVVAWEEGERFAFFANAYNAWVARLVLDAYPIESINDLSTEEERVWDRRFIPLGPHLEAGREKISLDELENAILRPRFEDARVHVAVNCASLGCPPLDRRPLVAEGLDAQLDRLMRAFLADRSRNRFDENEQTVRLSQIFNWFRDDFVQAEGSLLAYLQAYGPVGEAAWLEQAALEFLDYDWSLNDVPREKP